MRFDSEENTTDVSGSVEKGCRCVLIPRYYQKKKIGIGRYRHNLNYNFEAEYLLTKVPNVICDENGEEMFAEELKPVAGRKYGEDVTIREINRAPGVRSMA